MSTGRGDAMQTRVFFAAGPSMWRDYRAPLTQALAEAGVDALLWDDAPDPAAVDYIVFAPGGIISDFAPFTRAKAVLNLWAGVERLTGNATLTRISGTGAACGATTQVRGWHANVRSVFSVWARWARLRRQRLRG
jgi:hypothetical protein